MSRGLAGAAGRPLAVVVTRDGLLPLGADETVAEAGGAVLLVEVGTATPAGSSAAAAREAAVREAASGLAAATACWWLAAGGGLRPAALAAGLGPLLADVPLVLLPGSPDGRDLAPRLAAATGRPLLAHATRVALDDTESAGSGGTVSADLMRLEGRLTVAARCAAPAVATLVPGSRSVRPSAAGPVRPVPVELAATAGPAPDGPLDVEVTDVLEPLPETIGPRRGVPRRRRRRRAGAPRRQRWAARGIFALLTEVGAALGCSMGATRVVTDAGWIGYDRQIGTTGVTVDPDLYIAFGVSGAAQHTGGLGRPRHVISVNTDPACPMTAMADLAWSPTPAALLAELARRLGVALPSTPRPLWSPPVTDPLTPSPPEAQDVRVDAIVVGAGPAGAGRGPGAGPRRPIGAACSSGARSPARRTCTAASSTAGSWMTWCPSWWERGPGAAVGHPPLDDDDDRRAVADRRLPHRRRGAGRRTTA